MATRTGGLDMKAVESALEVLLLAYYEERRKPKPGERNGPLFMTLNDVPDMSEEEACRDRIVREPLAGTLWLGIRQIGEHLWHNTGSLDQMRSVLSNVVDRHPAMEGSLGNIVDKAWNGIGGSGGWIA